MQNIEKLLKGFGRFREQYFRSNDVLFEQLCGGQHPKAFLIACSDSRVDPAILTDCRPGDLFVVRNIANLVPPYETGTYYYEISSAIEYAVKSLKVEHIIVMGHSHCGGIEAFLRSDSGAVSREFIGQWVEIARPAREMVLREFGNETFEMQARACERASVIVSLKNLLTYPWLAERVQEGELTLHGWYFDLDTGQMLGYYADSGTFEELLA